MKVNALYFSATFTTRKVVEAVAAARFNASFTARRGNEVWFAK